MTHTKIHPLTFVTSALAVVALALSLLAITSTSGEAGASPAEPDARLVARLEAMEGAVERLEKRVSAVAASSRSTRMGPPAPEEPRLEELERRLASLETTTARDAAVHAADGPGTQGSVLARASAIEGFRNVALDRKAQVSMRLQALRMLCRIPNGRDREVVVAMAVLYRETDRASVQADIFRQLDGTTEPELEPLLLDALRDHASTEVRCEAAETLHHYLDQSGVREALTHAAENDASQRVRADARESLEP